MDNTIYELEDLIELLEEIRYEGEGKINFPNALYCLAREISRLNQQISYIQDLVPIKFKKRFPKHDENPFFSRLDMGTVDSKEFEAAKERMMNLLKSAEIKPENEVASSDS